MKRVTVHPEAEHEADEAFEWYWYRRESAALNFDASLKEAYSRLRRFPLACPPYLHGTRRALLKEFPFAVVFRDLPRSIQIVAVAHAKRRPGYWLKRLRQ